MAYGAAKTTSRLRLATLLFIHADLRIYRDPVKDHYKITEIVCREDFGGIRRSVSRYFAASLWAEVILRSPGAAEPVELYTLLLECLMALHSSDQAVEHGLSVQFMWRYLGYSGLQPDLNICAACDRSLGSSASGYLSEANGDVRCVECASPGDSVFSPGARAYLRHTGRLSPSRAAAVRMQDEKALCAVLYRMVQGALGTPLAALESGISWI